MLWCVFCGCKTVRVKFVPKIYYKLDMYAYSSHKLVALIFRLENGCIFSNRRFEHQIEPPQMETIQLTDWKRNQMCQKTQPEYRSSSFVQKAMCGILEGASIVEKTREQKNGCDNNNLGRKKNEYCCFTIAIPWRSFIQCTCVFLCVYNKCIAIPLLWQNPNIISNWKIIEKKKHQPKRTLHCCYTDVAGQFIWNEIKVQIAAKWMDER